MLVVGAFSALVEETLDPLDEPLDEPFPLLATPDPLLDPLLLLELTETLLPLLDPLLEEVTMMVPAGQTTSVTSTHCCYEKKAKNQLGGGDEEREREE